MRSLRSGACSSFLNSKKPYLYDKCFHITAIVFLKLYSIEIYHIHVNKKLDFIRCVVYTSYILISYITAVQLD